MNSHLEDLLANFSVLAFSIALLCTALACRRLALAGVNKAFGIAAWLAILDLAVYGAAYVAEWLIALTAFSSSNPALATKAFRWIDHGYQFSDFVHLLFTAVLATGLIRSARRLPPYHRRRPSDCCDDSQLSG